LARSMAARGRPPLFAHLDPALDLVDLADAARWFPDLDAALEWAEDALLARHPTGDRPGEIALAHSCLATGLAADDLRHLAGRLRRCELPAGAVLFRQGEAGDTLYLLARGRITVRLETAPGRFPRLATFMPGVMIGEMALLEGQPRSAEAVAAEDAVLHALSRADLDRIRAEHPALAARLMENVAREIAARLRAANRQLLGSDR
ncbi:MAG: cyclic nucleotide-binding domain-containing protein, partial [Alphaproteobacteria bacterium]|nr:cyclic nucleotide-binding domain-containing protein [Alphaproteobacteria bacterium]